MNSATEDQHVIAARDSGYMLYVRKCKLHDGVLTPRGARSALTLKEAFAKFCSSAEQQAKANLLRARRGHYLGIRKKGNRLENFLIVNPTADGDVRWLLRKIPELEASIIEVYVVDEVNRAKNATDLPTIGAEA